MKMPASPSLAVSVILLSAISASAQLIEAPTALTTGKEKALGLETDDSSSFAADKFLSGTYQLPEIRKSEADPTDSAQVFVNQDALTLGIRHGSARKVESVVDLSILKETSAYRAANLIKVKVSDEEASGIAAGLAQLSAAYQKPAQPSDSADCTSVGMSVEQRVKMDSSKVLEIVESEVAANPNCACEIVKIAIKASGADESLVGDITEVAITAAPESRRMISQCAIAAMPDALAAVQAVLAKLDPHSGDSSHSSKSSKSGKDAKEAVATAPPEPPNPLDLPPPLPPLPPPPPPPVITNPNPW
jgi:hypothetical protein